jgi:hypothetical protein
MYFRKRLEDINGGTRSRISKDSQYNAQKKKKGQTITNKTQRRKQNSSTPNITKNGCELQCSENKQYLQPV